MSPHCYVLGHYHSLLTSSLQKKLSPASARMSLLNHIISTVWSSFMLCVLIKRGIHLIFIHISKNTQDTVSDSCNARLNASSTLNIQGSVITSHYNWRINKPIKLLLATVRLSNIERCASLLSPPDGTVSQQLPPAPLLF